MKTLRGVKLQALSGSESNVKYNLKSISTHHSDSPSHCIPTMSTATNINGFNQRTIACVLCLHTAIIALIQVLLPVLSVLSTPRCLR